MDIKTVDIIGSMMDHGAVKKGVDMGPSAIRHAGLSEAVAALHIPLKDKGNIISKEEDSALNPKLRYVNEINEANEKLYNEVWQSLQNGDFPLVLGGDHSIAAGSAAASASFFKDIGIVWIDAHGDFNDENITPSGNMHGMPLSALCGLGPGCMVSFSKSYIDPKKACIIGARDLDPEEEIKLKKFHVNVFTMEDIKEYGISYITRKAISLAGGSGKIHLSFDMDAIEPKEAPGVGTPVPGGLSVKDARASLEILGSEGNIVSADFVEVNPLLDIRNMTGALAKDLIISFLEKKAAGGGLLKV